MGTEQLLVQLQAHRDVLRDVLPTLVCEARRQAGWPDTLLVDALADVADVVGQLHGLCLELIEQGDAPALHVNSSAPSSRSGAEA